MKKSRRNILLAGVLLLVIVLPLLIALVGRRQIIQKRAAFGEITVNLVPLEVTKTVAEPMTVEVFVNSNDKKVSAITVGLEADIGGLIVNNVQIAPESTQFFTDLIYDRNESPFAFTVLSKKPASQLPGGNFKLATLTITPYRTGNPITINTTVSNAVGFNATSEDVALSVVAGTTVAYTVSGGVCKIEQCTDKNTITLTEQVRPNNKFNVHVAFQKPTTAVTLSKIYRATGAAVPENHPDASLVGITDGTSFVDSNSTAGFSGLSVIHYDIDSYIICPGQTTATPTPTQSANPTPTAVPTATPVP